MGQQLTAFVAGLVFAVGLAFGGMTDPAKVIAFLDVTGHWDPSLAFVMGGAIAVHALAYRGLRRWSAPVFDRVFYLPTRRDIDPRLLLGAALFGVGWGLAGYCPGPALMGLATFGPGALVFVVSMLVGMAAFEYGPRLLRR
ncbi:MAG: YeeE/YedE family protein [Myxococcales bacterium]|nr:YeeE/YedE family protein [Myxococcales bacterium]